MLSIGVVDYDSFTWYLPVVQYIKVKLNEYRQQKHSVLLVLIKLHTV